MKLKLTRYDEDGEYVKHVTFEGWAVWLPSGKVGYSFSRDNRIGGNDQMDFTLEDIDEMAYQAESLGDQENPYLDSSPFDDEPLGDEATDCCEACGRTR